MISGFYKLSVRERLDALEQEGRLSAQEAAILQKSGALELERADRMIENVVGAVQLPLGIGTHFKINGREYLAPMAIEEPSVVAAASKAAKLTLPDGFHAEMEEPVMRGQIQIMRPKERAIEELEKHHDELLAIARTHAQPLEPYGGGVRKLTFREEKTARGRMLVAEAFVDVRDAMGANTVNTICEKLAPSIQDHAGGDIRLRIISNLATERKARAWALWKKEAIGAGGADAILDGYELARTDRYRCATHNKGIMNGIDAVAVATGNDWRAIEAGAHAYAALGGYRPLTHYEKTAQGDLRGSIELPVAAATVGGAVNTSPTAKIALKIAGVRNAQELAMLMACVGLANNFAALYALSTEGIQKGHMRLHARNIAVIAGAATPGEIDTVAEQLASRNDYSVAQAAAALKRVRDGK